MQGRLPINFPKFLGDGAIPAGTPRSSKAGAGGGSEIAAKIIQSSTTETGFDRSNPRRCDEVINSMNPCQLKLRTSHGDGGFLETGNEKEL